MAVGPENQTGNGAGIVVGGVTSTQGAWESQAQGKGQQVFQLQGVREAHIVQDPNVLLAILGKSQGKTGEPDTWKLVHPVRRGVQ